LATGHPAVDLGGVEQVPTELEGLRVQIDDVVYMTSLETTPDRQHPFV